MLIDKTHYGWGLASAAIVGAATVGYATAPTAAGGSVSGLTFGILSLLAMTFAGLLAVRKKFPAVRLGSAQFWLRGHIWLGLVSLPLALYHSGFRFGGTLEKVLMVTLIVVVGSGVYGLALQQVLPRFLKVRVPLETFPQQIPFLCQKLQEESEQLIRDLEGPVKKSEPPSAAEATIEAASLEKAAVAVALPATERQEAQATPAPEKPTTPAKLLAAKQAAACAAKAAIVPAAATKTVDAKSAALAALAAAKAKAAPAPEATATKAAAEVANAAIPRVELLAKFYREEMIPFLGSDSRVASRQDLASENYARMAFANLAVALPSQALEAIHRLDEIVAERRQFLVQIRIQNWLRNWLLVHVPLSAALFALAAVHVVMALRVVPWSK